MNEAEMYITYIYPLQFVVHENERMIFLLKILIILHMTIRYYIELLGRYKPF